MSQNNYNPAHCLQSYGLKSGNLTAGNLSLFKYIHNLFIDIFQRKVLSFTFKNILQGNTDEKEAMLCWAIYRQILANKWWEVKWKLFWLRMELEWTILRYLCIMFSSSRQGIGGVKRFWRKIIICLLCSPVPVPPVLANIMGIWSNPLKNSSI